MMRRASAVARTPTPLRRRGKSPRSAMMGLLDDADERPAPWRRMARALEATRRREGARRFARGGRFIGRGDG